MKLAVILASAGLALATCVTSAAGDTDVTVTDYAGPSSNPGLWTYAMVTVDF